MYTNKVRIKKFVLKNLFTKQIKKEFIMYIMHVNSYLLNKPKHPQKESLNHI